MNIAKPGKLGIRSFARLARYMPSPWTWEKKTFAFIIKIIFNIIVILIAIIIIIITMTIHHHLC